MDRFIKVKRDTRPSGFIGDVTAFNSIATIIDDNGMVCVYGPSGVGKTYIVNLALKDKNWVEISSMKDIPLIEESTCHVVIDADKIDKSFLDHGKKISLGSTIFITKKIDNINFCDCIKINPPTIDTLVQIGRKTNSKISLDFLTKCAEKCNGDIRAFLFSLQFDAERDMFRSSKEYIHDKLCSNEDILSDLGKDINDHGYIWDIVYTNYPIGGLDPDIADSMSIADMYDARVYNNSWDMMDHFWLNGITYPICKLNRPLEKAALKPGIAWTKFSNYRMRKKKLSTMPPNDICRTIMYMIKRVPYEEALELLKSYNMKSKDMDVLNLLCLDSKIPVKTIKKFKNDLSSDS